MKPNFNTILKMEETSVKDVQTVEQYVEELEAMAEILEHHRDRCIAWNKACNRDVFGKLHGFLSMMETEA